ncbi:MAG: glycosyltransferase family 2 protein [Gammaproteobacteria bacterium]|nr:glycosyltransferase family 2 protein [Gammaproteobacteria bacterium]
MHASSPSKTPSVRAEAADAPLVSVGLPVYNGERFLRGAIDSILTQSLTNFELIISDNASSDGTWKICQEYAAGDRRIRCFRHPSNLGLPHNWNFTVAQARGQFFKWATANDLCAPNLLANCVKVLEIQPEVVLCYGRTTLIDEDDRALGVWQDDRPLLDASPSERFKTACYEMSLNNAISGVCRLSVLRGTGLIRPYQGSDAVIMGELALAGHFWMLPEVLLQRRMGPETFSACRSPEEIRKMHDPKASGRFDLTKYRKQLDLICLILRAPGLGVAERSCALIAAVRHAYWALGAR